MHTQSKTEMKLAKQYFWICSQCSSGRHIGHPEQPKWQSAEAVPAPAHTPNTGRFLSYLLLVPPPEHTYLHFCLSPWQGRHGQRGRVACPPSTALPAVPGSCAAGTKMSRWRSFLWKSAARDYAKLQPLYIPAVPKIQPLTMTIKAVFIVAIRKQHT